MMRTFIYGIQAYAVSFVLGVTHNLYPTQIGNTAEMISTALFWIAVLMFLATLYKLYKWIAAKL